LPTCIFSLPDPPLKNARLDLRLSSETPFRIRNNIVRGSLRPDLRITGTGEIPVLVGEIYVESARAVLPTGVIRVESGLVRFLEIDPDRPRLEITGLSRMMGYDISVRVEGPYDAPLITLSSVPPLPEDELLLLLLTGKPPRLPMDRTGGRQTGMNVAVYLGKGLIKKWMGKDASETDDDSVIDRFEIYVGRGVTRKGNETLEASFQMLENVIRPGDALYLTAEKDLYDDYNTGVRLVFRFR